MARNRIKIQFGWFGSVIRYQVSILAGRYILISHPNFKSILKPSINNRQRAIPITYGEGQLVPPEFFLNNLNPPSTSNTDTQPSRGACLRWAVGMSEDKLPRFEMQGLPTAACNVQKKFFSSDNSVSVLLGCFNLNADIFDGSFAHGLVPIFFSANPVQAQAFLDKNPAAAKEAISSINSRFLHMEHLSLEEAAAYLQAKKGRMAKGVAAFAMPATSRKRGRPANTSISGSGT
jgi:hypothetical protein